MQLKLYIVNPKATTKNTLKVVEIMSTQETKLNHNNAQLTQEKADKEKRNKEQMEEIENNWQDGRF